MNLLNGQNNTCADPESFVRGGPTFFFLKLMRGERIQISLQAGHHRLASETPFNDRPTLNAGLVA